MQNRIYYFRFTFLALLVTCFTSCTSVHRTMRESNTKVIFNKSDFQLSEQLTRQQKTIKVLGVDWARLFTKRTGVINRTGVPIIGRRTSNRTVNYALYYMINDHPDYDVVFYPQYEVQVQKPALGIGWLLKITDVTVKARLGQLKQE